jgi:hypothetical protein
MSKLVIEKENNDYKKTNLLKYELGISNGLASLLYLPLVSSSNAMTLKWHFSIINAAV